MAHSYGPAKQWRRCAAHRVEITSVRSWDSGSIDLVVQQHPSLDQQVLRLSREEATNLQEALRRVLATEGSSSWEPYVIGKEPK